MVNNPSSLNSQSSIVNSQSIRVVFFGTPSFTDPIVNSLSNNFELIKVIRSPQKWSNETIEQFRSLRPDFFVVAAYGQILPPEIISIPKKGSINIHPSILPKYRGPSPIQSAILEGDLKTGISIIKIDEQIDHGPILMQKEENILPNDTFESLAIKLFDMSKDMVVDTINKFEGLQAKPQDDSEATYTKILTKQDGFIDLSNPSQLKIENLKLKIRAFSPWPGVWTKFTLNGKEVIIKLLPEEKIQVEGKKPMSYRDFINGYPEGKFLLQKLSLI